MVEHPEPVSLKGLVPPVMIELRNVTKKLGERTILDGVNLQVFKGETLCILGGSGQGKSVTLKHIVGLLQPDSGTVLVEGIDISQPKNGELDEVRKKIGYLFQNGALLGSLDVYENVALPLREHERPPESEVEDRVKHALTLVGLGDAIHKMPAVLSGGMRKRASLARALIREPDIVLYDEPTAGLDPIMSATINEVMLKVQAETGVTSILVTHDMGSAFKVSNRMAMLWKGKILKIGTTDDFKHSDDPIIRQFVNGEPEGPLT